MVMPCACCSSIAVATPHCGPPIPEGPGWPPDLAQQEWPYDVCYTMMGTFQGPPTSPSPWVSCGNVLCPLLLRGSPQHCLMSHSPCHPTAPRRDGVCRCPGALCKHTMSACTRACPTAHVPARCVPELGTACAAGSCALVISSSHRATCSGQQLPDNHGNYSPRLGQEANAAPGTSLEVGLALAQGHSSCGTAAPPFPITAELLEPHPCPPWPRTAVTCVHPASTLGAPPP